MNIAHVMVIGGVLLAFASMCLAEGKVRPPACAGGWYPADAKALKELVEKDLAAAKAVDLPGECVAIIAPHAGYAYSGPTAAAAMKAVAGKAFSRVILIGPSHYAGASFTGGAVPTVDAFETPLGEVPLDRAACDKLTAGGKVFIADDKPHAREHCLEMELPLLQSVLKDFKIVPILVGAANAELTVAMAKAIREIADEKTLIVVSTDFTHHGPNYGYTVFRERVGESLARLDGGAIDRILAVDRLGFVDYVDGTKATICGRWAVAVALEVFADRPDVEGVQLAYTTSGAVTGDYANSVSYAAIAMCRGWAAPLSAADRQCLLKLAREQVAHYLATGKELADVEKTFAKELTGKLKKPGAAFVTLKRGGQLRGCIGHVVPLEPTYASVLANAISACRDPRFTTDPITAKEVPELHIEISLLSRYRQIASTDEIKIGRDGLIIRGYGRSGLLLPQVPVEQEWDLKAYLQGICRKAGLPNSAVEDRNVRLYRFSAEVFGEKEPKETGP